MTDHKTQLVALRDQQLSALRGRLNKPERLSLGFACADRDTDYDVTFARLSASARFTCEKVEPAPKATGSAILKGLFRSQRPALRIAAHEIDLGFACTGCGVRAGWTLCARCGAFVCAARSDRDVFTCRKSCGDSFRTGPLTEVSAARNAPTSGPAIGRAAMTALPKRR